MSKALAQKQDQQIAPANMIDIIAKAAADPNIDVDKMDRLLSMHERISAKQAEQEYARAMSAAQAEMRPIATDAENPQTSSKYASHAALDKALRPIYTKHGFSLSYDTGDCPKDDHIRCILNVFHEAGHLRQHHIDVPIVTTGIHGKAMMTLTHATFSATSYGNRYLLRFAFNIAVGEADDDGNAAGMETLSEGQIADLEAKIEEVGANKDAFLKYCKVTSLDKIPAKNFKAVCAALEAKARQKHG